MRPHRHVGTELEKAINEAIPSCKTKQMQSLLTAYSCSKKRLRSHFSCTLTSGMLLRNLDLDILRTLITALMQAASRRRQTAWGGHQPRSVCR